MLDKCHLCGNDLKRTIGSSVINTRLEDKKQLVVEDLKFINCTVCSYKELDPEYEDIPKELLKVYSRMNKKKVEKLMEEGKVSYKEILRKDNNDNKEYANQPSSSNVESILGRFLGWKKKRAFMKKS